MTTKNFNKTNIYTAINTRTGEIVDARFVRRTTKAVEFHLANGKYLVCTWIVNSSTTYDVQALDYRAHYKVNTNSAH